MRLLKCDGPGEYSLVQVRTHNTLPYAILSHTWIDGQEITYQELISGTGKHKSGYEKIKFCAEQAAKDGYLYFWIDTCCIDKSNSTELTTAINSMFRWYRNAKKCYVYLADVSASGYDTAAKENSSKWEAAFSSSRWFTRGWTLQELIAPTTVEFFSKEGNRLGDRSTLERNIHEITKIPILALQGNSLSDFSIAERQSWAAERQTTEEEDLVYCLLGLCEVSMPNIYGEGWKAASKRLELTIGQFSNKSIVSPSAQAAPFIVPFESNSRFTGRELQLTQLEESLFSARQTTRTAIVGLGGVGKTQLALEYVHQLREKSSHCSIFWIPATSMESLHQGYLEVGRCLGISGSEKDEVDIKKLVRDHLSRESAGEWLLVFDNADDISMWTSHTNSESGSDRLIDLLPNSRQGRILFTSRDRKAAVKLAQQNIIDLTNMGEDVALQLLRKCLIHPSVLYDEADARTLLHELTYLPLAIVQAAAYINENRIAFGDYLELLADQEENVIELLSEEFEDQGRYHQTKNPVATTWFISFEQIRHQHPLAAEYLSFMCCINPKDIPQSLLPPGPSRKKEIEAIGTLDAYSFVTKRPLDDSFDIHRLVHLATRNWLRNENQLAQTTERVLMHLEQEFPNHDHMNRTLWRRLLPHAQYVLASDLIGHDHQGRIDLQWNFALCLVEDGRWDEAESVLIGILEIRKRVLGDDDPATLETASRLAWIYDDQGRWDEAVVLQVQVMEARQRILGANHRDTLSSINNLAWIYSEQGRWDVAEQLQLQVVETNRTMLGIDHLETLISTGNLAAIYSNQGRLNEAEVLEVQVMERSKLSLGPEHPNTVVAMYRLALTYWLQSRWSEAEELEVQELEISKIKLGAHHPDTLTSMNNLASIYSSQGRWSEAEELQVQVLEISKTKLRAHHPDTLTSMNNLASIYSSQGRWNEAEELQVQVLEIRKTKLGAHHPDNLTSIANLASTYSKQGRWSEAEELQVQVLEISKTKLRAHHPSTLTTMANLAATYSNQGRWSEAEELEVQVLEMRKTKLGAHHSNTLTTMGNLARTYFNQGRWNKAEELEVQVLETRNLKLGVQHPDTLISMNNLAITWKQQCRDMAAIELMQECVVLSTKVLGADHPRTSSSREALLDWHEEKSRLAVVPQGRGRRWKDRLLTRLNRNRNSK